VEVKDLFGASQKSAVPVSGIGPLIVLKLNAFAGRQQAKHAYDVLLGVSRFIKGPDAAISGFQAEAAANNNAALLETCASFVHCKAMQLTLPPKIEARLSPQSAALHLAIGLFVSDEATLGQAAEVAGLSQTEFLRELGKRRIPIHYGAEELAEDLRAVESLATR